MPRVIFYVVVFLVFGCDSSIQLEDIKHLNGYWEIKEVEFTNGQTKEYTINTTIDYIEVDRRNGFRKKVQPQLNGFYQTSNDAENFKIIEKDGIVNILYGNGTQQWEETLITIDENSFSVRNQNNNIYRYKRYEPINLEP